MSANPDNQLPDMNAICRRCDEPFFKHQEHEGMHLCPFRGLNFEAIAPLPATTATGELGPGICVGTAEYPSGVRKIFFQDLLPEIQARLMEPKREQK